MIPQIRVTNPAYNDCDTPGEIESIFADVYRILRAHNHAIIKIGGKGAKADAKKERERSNGKFVGILLMFVLSLCTIAQGGIKWTWDMFNADGMEKWMNDPQMRVPLDLENGAYITNATNNAIELFENSEALILTFGTNDLDISSDTGVLKADWDTIIVAANEFLFNPTADANATEGTVFYDSDTDKLMLRNASTWVDLTAGAGTPAGSDTQIQYNNGGAFGGIASFVWDDINVKVLDDVNMVFGTGSDWHIGYDESVDDQLIIRTEKTSAAATTDPMLEILVGATPTADQQVFGVAKGTQASNTALLTLDEDGDIVVAGTATMTDLSATGNVDLGDNVADTVTITGSIDGDVYLDDGSGSPPQLIFKDGSDETAAFNKTLTGALNLTTQSDDGLTILTGNLRVGNGTPGTAPMDGEDAYIEGQIEFDAQATFDAVAVHNDWIDLNEELDIDMDNADESVTITTSAQDYTADSAIVMVETTGAATNNTYLLRLQHTADGDAQDHFLVCEDNDGDDVLAVNSGGDTTLTIRAAAGNVVIDADTTANTSTAGVIDLNHQTATNGGTGISITTQLEDNATTAYGIDIDVDDDATGGETFYGLNVGNSAGTTSTVVGINLENTLDDGIIGTIGAAGQFAVVDAKTTANTGTSGVIDASFQSATDNAVFLDIDAQMGNAGANDVVRVLQIWLDDDDSASAGGEEFIAIDVNSGDMTGNALVTAFHVSEADVALQADQGYVRIGTGSSFTTTLGDDDLGVEGDMEVDGAVILDGGTLTLGSGIIVSTALDTRIEITENSDTFGLIFGSNKVELASCNGTAVTTIDCNNFIFEDMQYLAGHYGQKIDFSHNELIEFGDTEKLGLIFSGTNIIELGTDTGVTTLDMNTVDNITDVESIQYDDDALSKLMCTTVQLSAAEVNDLVGTPKQLVAAPGADYLVWPIEAILILDAGSEVLVESADNLVIGWNNAAVAAGETIETTGFIDQATDTITNWHMAKDEINAAAGIVNKNLAIKNDSGDFTGNTSRDAAMTITIFYRIVKVGL